MTSGRTWLPQFRTVLRLITSFDRERIPLATVNQLDVKYPSLNARVNLKNISVDGNSLGEASLTLASKGMPLWPRHRSLTVAPWMLQEPKKLFRDFINSISSS
jgi:hypothetical protein